MCTKKGQLHLYVPPSRFELLTADSAISTYTFGTHTAKHHFCAQCGIAPFYRARSRPSDYDVNARCLDRFQDIEPRFVIELYDGRNWEKAYDEEQQRRVQS